ncbi:hypothetical protein CRUP_031402 [Coryphaenoides rupestris]|nr:hypothetical protein CRUP_031402 [Coryphaenoides rupestris]
MVLSARDASATHSLVSTILEPEEKHAIWEKSWLFRDSYWSAGMSAQVTTMRQMPWQVSMSPLCTASLSCSWRARTSGSSFNRVRSALGREWGSVCPLLQQLLGRADSPGAVKARVLRCLSSWVMLDVPLNESESLVHDCFSALPDPELFDTAVEAIVNAISQPDSQRRLVWNSSGRTVSSSSSGQAAGPGRPPRPPPPEHAPLIWATAPGAASACVERQGRQRHTQPGQHHLEPEGEACDLGEELALQRLVLVGRDVGPVAGDLGMEGTCPKVLDLRDLETKHLYSPETPLLSPFLSPRYLWYLVSGIWYLVSGTWYVVPGQRYLVPGQWYLVSGIWYRGGSLLLAGQSEGSLLLAGQPEGSLLLDGQSESLQSETCCWPASNQRNQC